MNAEIARVIGAFLQRVELKGSEVEAFNVAIQALADIINEETGEETVHVGEVEH